jgi:hypothetical protein
MPIFYFDYRSEGNLVQDGLGTELDTLEEARAAAVHVLAAMAQARWERSEPHEVVIEVRNERQVVLQVVLTLEISQLA